eukprot:304383-Rhodomonas_salina.1
MAVMQLDICIGWEGEADTGKDVEWVNLSGEIWITEAGGARQVEPCNEAVVEHFCGCSAQTSSDCLQSLLSPHLKLQLLWAHQCIHWKPQRVRTRPSGPSIVSGCHSPDVQ